MMISIFIIAHLLADFFFQTADMANRKKKEGKSLLLHSFLYFFIFLLAYLLVIDLQYLYIPLLVLSAFHILIDFFKEKIEIKFIENSSRKSIFFTSFLIDQSLHFLTILFVYYYFRLEEHGNAFYSLYQNSKNFHNGTFYVLMFLIVLSPTSVFIKKMFLLIPQKRMKEVMNENLRIGSLIGQLERIIIVLFLLNDQYGAIGLVLTAKSIARFKQMEDKDFAEKYLVGTLASLLIALLTTMFLKNYLI